MRDPLRSAGADLPPLQTLLARDGDAVAIVWLTRDDRCSEALHPDVSIADLISEIDPIRVDEGRYLADE